MALDHTTRLMIERVNWAALEHAYGSAADAPEAFAALASADPEERASGCDFLFYSAYHQGTVYGATVEVVPVLVQMLATEGIPNKHELLNALRLMANGTSYHEVHRGMMLMGNTDTPEYQAKVDRELAWVNEVKRRVRAGLSVYLPLFGAAERLTRLCVPLVLIALLRDESEAIRPAAVAALERETDPACKAAALVVAAASGEPMRPRWDAELKSAPQPVRTVAAMYVAFQEKASAPADAVDALLSAMTAPDPELVTAYREVPTQGDLTADAGAALSWTGESNIARVVDNVIADLQRGPDMGLQRVELMLQMACTLAKKVPFAAPEALNALEARVARECRRQLGLSVGGIGMSGFVNYTDLLGAYGLPQRETEFDAYLARVPG